MNLKASDFQVIVDDTTLNDQLAEWELGEHELKLSFDMSAKDLAEDGLAVGQYLYPTQEDFCYLLTAKVKILDLEQYRLDLRYSDFRIRSGNLEDPLRVEVTYTILSTNR
jgi:hypothetical protein